MRTLAPAALFMVVLAACGGDAPTVTAPDASTLARADHESQPRPLTGRCETVLAPPEVVAPGVIRQVDTGACRFTHLGRTQFYSDKLIDVVAGTQTTQATFTASNGDALHAVGSGTNVPSVPGRVSFTATLTAVGGTGRFAGATGEAHVEGEANLVNRTSALTIDGWIAYDDSEGGDP
ncbi:MAG: hypothetical protein M3373_07970 [Gemmatimonadota bacterium]|nr:hypothetical protein [Gemmatimonadota bacterium]